MAYKLLPGIVNRVHVCCISSIFLYFHWYFHSKHYFYDQETFVGFLKSDSARLYLKVLRYLGWTWKQCALTVFYVIIRFVSSLALFFSRKKWVSYLSHAISPNFRGKMINSTTAFYWSFCCMFLPKILNIIIFNWKSSITCICQLYFMLFHM